MSTTSSETGPLTIPTGNNFRLPAPKKFEGEHYYHIQTEIGKIAVLTGKKPIQGNVLKTIREQGTLLLKPANQTLDSLPIYQIG